MWGRSLSYMWVRRVTTNHSYLFNHSNVSDLIFLTCCWITSMYHGTFWPNACTCKEGENVHIPICICTWTHLYWQRDGLLDITREDLWTFYSFICISDRALLYSWNCMFRHYMIHTWKINLICFPVWFCIHISDCVNTGFIDSFLCVMGLGHMGYIIFIYVSVFYWGVPMFSFVYIKRQNVFIPIYHVYTCTCMFRGR